MQLRDKLSDGEAREWALPVDVRTGVVVDDRAKLALNSTRGPAGEMQPEQPQAYRLCPLNDHFAV
jgi:hypothetical protein